MNAGSKSTGYEEHNHEQHRSRHWSRHQSKTDWANLTCPLIGTALRVVPIATPPDVASANGKRPDEIGSG